MAARKRNTLQGLRGNHILELSRQGAVYEHSKVLSESKRKCSTDKTELQKEYSKINIKSNVKLPEKVEDTQLKINLECLQTEKGREYSSTQTRTDLEDNILKTSNDSLAIIVDDPELLDVIRSIQTDVYVNLDENIEHTFNKILTEKVSPVPPEYTNLEEINDNNSDLVTFFESFTADNTPAQLPIQPNINLVENEIRNESNNSNDSISILNSTSEHINQLNLEREPQLYKDIADNAVDREWIPGSDDKPTSDSDVTDAENQPSDQNFQPNNSVEKEKIKRKRIADRSKWNDMVNKKRRECGEAYKGWSKHKGEQAKRGAERPERKLEPACISDHCKKTRDCQKIMEPQREFMFNFFWKKMSWDQKKVYVASRVSSETPKRRTTGDGNTSRRKTSFAYSLKTTDDKIFKVCKKMFLSTLGLNEWMVTNWIKDSKAGMSESTLERNKGRQKEQTAANRKDLEDFIDQLPKLPSHYCRKSTTKIYLEPTFKNSMSEIYNEYIKKCATYNPPQKPLSRFTFDLVIKEKNIGFQPPKKDRCDLCISYETGNVEEEAYQNHIAKKEKARYGKNKDKSAAEEGTCVVLTMDLQAVKICPSLNASALYYKTKLCVHNFTVYNVNTHHCRCYWFDETEADLTENTFASCLMDYLSKTVCESRIPVIIWSDGCTYQNRNATLSNALLSFSVDKGITIYQKYLTKGHTQMEADSVHATIERKIKNKSIHLPSDYTRLTLEARRNPQAYEVESLDFTFCQNFGGVDMVYPSIRPGKIAGDPQVTDIVAIQYSPDGRITVKTSLDNEYQDLPKKRGKRPIKPVKSFPKLHNQRLPIKHQKWLHLQQLKEVIPRDCHIFYDNLPHD